MEKKITVTVSNLVFILGTMVFSLLFSKVAFAQNSVEMSCRSKAKEIAAETYKGCMTEMRQSQIEQIRKDYKEKLTDLKSHYDNELKKLSSNQEGAPDSTVTTLKAKIENKKAELKRPKQRASGARLPQKKFSSQVLDFTRPANDSQNGTTDENIESRGQTSGQINGQITKDAGNQDDIEVVDVGVQE